MDLSRPWWTTAADLHGNKVGVSYDLQHGFRWHGPANVSGGYKTARAAAQSLLDRYGSHIGWQEGEALLRACRDYDLARKLQETANGPRPTATA
jgi:hypothetical protein